MQEPVKMFTDDTMSEEFIPDSKTPYLVDFRGKEFYFTTCGALFPKSQYATLSYECEMREEWWEIEPGQVVVDVGAAYGSYTLTALAAGASFVIAIEPARWCFFDLHTNLLLNGFWDRCMTANVLVGDRVGVANFYPTSTSMKEEGKAEERMITTLDAVVSAMPLSRLDWVKIDVEGSEVDVLKGAMETLVRWHPRLVIENHVGFDATIPDTIVSMLTPLGYTEERKTDTTISNGSWSRWTWRG